MWEELSTNFHSLLIEPACMRASLSAYKHCVLRDLPRPNNTRLHSEIIPFGYLYETIFVVPQLNCCGVSYDVWLLNNETGQKKDCINEIIVSAC